MSIKGIKLVTAEELIVTKNGDDYFYPVIMVMNLQDEAAHISFVPWLVSMDYEKAININTNSIVSTFEVSNDARIQYEKVVESIK